MTNPIWLTVVSIASKIDGAYAHHTVGAYVEKEAAANFVCMHDEPFRRCMVRQRTLLHASEDALVHLCFSAGAAACRRALEMLETAAQ